MRKPALSFCAVACLCFVAANSAHAATVTQTTVSASTPRISRTHVLRSPLSRRAVRQAALVREARFLARKRTSPLSTTRRVVRQTTVAATATPTTVSGREASSSSARALPSPAEVVSPELAAARASILRLVNEARASAGLSALRANALLNRSAQEYAKDMEKRSFFSHTDPDGRASVDRIRLTGYITAPCDCQWRYWTGENLGMDQKTPEEVMRDWMASPGHRDNILNPHYTEIGIGWSGKYWVEHFGDIRED